MNTKDLAESELDRIIYLRGKIRQMLDNWDFIRRESSNSRADSYEKFKKGFEPFDNYYMPVSLEEAQTYEATLGEIRNSLREAMKDEALNLIKKIQPMLNNRQLALSRSKEIKWHLDTIRSVDLTGKIALKSPDSIENSIIDLYRIQKELLRASTKSISERRAEKTGQIISNKGLGNEKENYITKINKVLESIGFTENIPDLKIRFEAAKKDSNPHSSLANLKRIYEELHDFVVASAKGPTELAALKQKRQNEGAQRQAVISELEEGIEAILKIYKSPIRPTGIKRMEKLLKDPNVNLAEVIDVARTRLMESSITRDPMITEFYLRVTKMSIHQPLRPKEEASSSPVPIIKERYPLSLSALQKVERQYRLSKRLERLMNINTEKQPNNIQRFLEILRTEMKKDYLPLQERIEKILDQARDEKLNTDGNEISQKVCNQLFRYIKGIHENTQGEGKGLFKDLTSFTNWPRRTEVSQKAAKEEPEPIGKTPSRN
jgi:hypothetical protein